MFAAILYEYTTGQITRIMQTTQESDLALQERSDTEALLPVDPTAPVVQQSTQYRVEAGAIVPKAALIFEPDRLTFTADGTDEVAVTVLGLTQPCQIQVNGVRSNVTPEEAILIVTSDAPGQFVVAVPAEEPHYWAAPITLVAT